MKLKCTGSHNQRRARVLTLEATTDIEAALLYAHFLKMRDEPLTLAPQLQSTLDAIGNREVDSAEIADELDLAQNTVCNRFLELRKLGLISRKPQILARGKSFLYWRNLPMIAPEKQEVTERQTFFKTDEPTTNAAKLADMK
jgi:predicted transcriptional regulator